MNTSSRNSSSLTEPKYLTVVYYLFYMTLTLAALRLLTFEIWQMISDGLSGLMLYFFLIARGKCMAIFILFNGLLGVFSAFSRASYVMSYVEMQQVNFFAYVFMIICLYAVIVYLGICIVGVLGIMRYSWENMFGGLNQSRNDNTQQYGSYNYNQPRGNNDENTGFVAFRGRGTTVV